MYYSKSDQPLQRFHRIFSGKASKRLWKMIDKVKPTKTNEVIYELVNCCEDLEYQVRALESRIAKLEDR